jgi:hypothetical protein
LNIGLEASEGSGDTVDERAASLIGIDATEARFMFLSTQLGTA